MIQKTLTIDEVSERLSEVDEQVNHAIQAVKADRGSSPVLEAVVEQFYEKCKKALSALEDGDEESVSEHVIELEQAGDSAKVAAQADAGVSANTRNLIVAAHDIVCELKSDIIRS